MSEQLVICLIAVAANLVGMMAIYAGMSNAIARGRTFAAVVVILISQLFWIVPGLWIVETQVAAPRDFYALWLGNWLVSGFSIVLFCKITALIPAALNDTVRTDGLGGFAAWRRTVLPFVKRDLLILGAFTTMATLLLFWGAINSDARNVTALFEQKVTATQYLAKMLAGSLLGVLPLVAIFFAAKRNR